jgi:hydrogenase maturation factor
MAKSLILVQDAAGEKVIIHTGYIVRVTERDDGKSIEILAREPVWDSEMEDPDATEEVNMYYSTLTLAEFLETYA